MLLDGRGLRTRWGMSALYPASRPAARLARVMLRLKALATPARRCFLAGNWELGDFVASVLPGAVTVAVLAGTPGPAQKIMIQVWGRLGVIGYVKFAQKPGARMRLQRETRVLSELPAGVGPKLLKSGALASGFAVVLEAVPGKLLSARLPAKADLPVYLKKLAAPLDHDIGDHPWVGRLIERHGPVTEAWMEPLAKRRWPVVIQHGDFAPWNVLQETGGSLKAIDWEYGTIESFPFLDFTYYLLQVAALIHRWPPQRAHAYALKKLNNYLPLPGARALIKLTAFDAYQKLREDGHSDDTPLQVWRRAIWGSRL